MPTGSNRGWLTVLPWIYPLREEVVNTLLDWAKATLPFPTGMRPWGPDRVKTFYQQLSWRP